jgi:hypothetical protein
LLLPATSFIDRSLVAEVEHGAVLRARDKRLLTSGYGRCKLTPRYKVVDGAA